MDVAGEGDGAGGHEGAHTETSQQQAGGGAGEDQQKTLRGELAQHASAAGAERDANRDLPLADFGAGQQQVGDIGARDHQYEGHRHQKNEQGGVEIAQNLALDGTELDAAALVGGGIGLFQALTNAVHLALGACQRDAGPEARQHRGAAGAAVGDILAANGHHQGQPEFGAIFHAAEPGRHDADDGVRLAVELKGAADDRGIAAESPLPQRIAQDDDGIALRHFVLFGPEGAAEGGMDAEQRKIRLGDVFGRDALPLVHAGEGRAGVREEGHVLERAALRAPVAVVRHGGAPAFHLRPLDIAPQFDQAGRRGIRERAEDDGIDDAENGGVGANAEGQGENRHEGECGAVTQGSHRVAQVLPQGFEPVKRPHLSTGLLPQGGVAELVSGGAGGIFESHTGLAVPAGAGGEMEFEFLFQLAIEAAAQEQRAQAEANDADPFEVHAVSMTRETAPESRTQCEVSAARYLRPAAVRR